LDPCKLKDCNTVALGHGDGTMIHVPTIQRSESRSKDRGGFDKVPFCPSKTEDIVGLSRRFFLSDRHLSSHSVEYGGKVGTVPTCMVATAQGALRKIQVTM
jgi:hypothetical protein